MGCFQFGVYTWGIHVGGNSVLFSATGKKNKTRGSQEPVIAHLVFNLTFKLIENGGVTHNFESGPLKDHFKSNF